MKTYAAYRGSAMISEREFVQARFEIVKDRLEDQCADIERLDRIQLQREYRLLGKVLHEVKEGHVLQALDQWRIYFGQELAQHKAANRAQQEAYDSWWRQSPDERSQTSKPEPPSLGVQVTSRDGQVFVIDDRYLAMMDDLIVRLEKWLDDTD
jgi:hypothetical protein